MILTARDRRLLEDLQAYGILTTRSVAARQFQGIAKTTVLNDVNRIKARITGYAGQIESLTERLSELPSTVSATPIFKQMEKLEELKRQDEELLAKTKANQQRDKPMDVKSFTRILGQINATRKNLDDGWKAKIIEKLVHKVELFPNRLAIHFYVGQSLLQGESLSKEGGSPFFFSAEQKSSRKRKSLNQLRALHSNTAKPPVGSSNTIDYGEGCDKLLELSALSCNTFYTVAWRETIDLTELARKRWVEKLSMDRIAADLGWGRTAVIRYLGKIRANPNLVLDGEVRLRVHRRKRTFMGGC